jgi:CcmD family protein
MDNLGFLVAAYLAVWLGLFGYLIWLGTGLRNTSNELQALKAKVQASAPPEPAAPPAEPTPAVPAERH